MNLYYPLTRKLSNAMRCSQRFKFDPSTQPKACNGRWSFIAVVRSLHYFFKVKYGIELDALYPLTWLRYRLFIILYPLGFAGEVACLYETKIIEGWWSLLFVPYFFGLLFMMKHMFGLGKKKLRNKN